MLKTHRPTAAPTLARTMTGEEDGQELPQELSEDWKQSSTGNWDMKYRWKGQHSDKQLTDDCFHVSLYDATGYFISI